MVLEIQFRLQSISPFSILKINILCQISFDKSSKALKIQKHSAEELISEAVWGCGFPM